MSLAHLDPQFRSYLREPPRISYTNPDDAWLVRNFVSSLEILLGTNGAIENARDGQLWIDFGTNGPDTARTCADAGSSKGVGYLDDGTMIVVEEGERHINSKVPILVTSVLQTSAGRMIFGRCEAA